MKSKLEALSRHYRASLRNYLDHSQDSAKRPPNEVGAEAIKGGFDSLDMARIHEQALIDLLPLDGASPVMRTAQIGRAGIFFNRVIAPIEKVHRAAVEAGNRLRRLERKKGRRGGESPAAIQRLNREVARREAAEAALKKSVLHYSQLLAQSRQMRGRLQHLSHQIILSQESERKEISRELHDQIAQTLSGINVHLAALRIEDATNTRGLGKKIASTQRLVEKSVDIVHRFARELRPTILDDLGLIPALRSHLNEFAKRSRLAVRFKSAAEVEQLSNDERTMLYRVSQAALSNVASHAKAAAVSVVIRVIRAEICMEIHDNGKGFEVENVLLAKRHKRLGVIGMRERVEMVGGSFAIASEPGKGTTVRVCIPMRGRAKAKRVY